MAAAAPTAATEAPAGLDRNGPLKDEDAAEIRKRIELGRQDRKRYELLWQECLAFAQGKHHLCQVGRGTQRQLVLPDLPKGRVRYTVDELTQFRMTILGELSMDDDRPQVLFRQEDEQDENLTEQTNDAIAYGWESEWVGDEVLEDVRRYLIDMGTAAVRCRFDKTAGPVRQQVPMGQDGPILDLEEARAHVAEAAARGETAKFQDVHEGRIRWQPGSPFNLIVPPGVKRERDFPWICWVEAVHTDRLHAEFPKSKVVKPDQQLADVNQLGDRELSNLSSDSSSAPAKLQDHALVYTYMELPSTAHPEGRVVVMAGEKMQVIDSRPRLDYVAPDGTPRTGIHLFHFIRLSDRFWSKGIVEGGMDPQRYINKIRALIQEIIERGLPKVFAENGSIDLPKGLPLEVIWTKPGKPKPLTDPGTSPGAWMFQQVEALREDLARAVGVQDVSLGENPQGVGNYSQLALLREQDGRKLDPVINGIKSTIAHLIEDSLYDIRRYWPREKQVAIAGPDGGLKAFTFDKSKLPDFYRVEIPKGAAKPRSQAAQLKMIDDIATYAINSRQPLPVEWVKESYGAGKALELPQAPQDDQTEKAHYENAMLAEGEDPGVDYFDNHALHVMEHRSIQIQAKLSQRPDIYELCEQHIQEHLAVAQQNAAQQQAPQPALPAGEPAAPAVG